MNRVLKFRAWDKKDNKWLLGYGYGTLGGFSMFGEVMMMGEWAQLISHRLDDLDNIALMQSTGLSDKKGKEIFEGDILADENIGKTKGHVVFHKGAFRLQRTVELPSKWLNDTYVYHYTKRHSVIGNLYENPELLKT